MSDGGGQVSHAMRRVAEEMRGAEEPQLADEVTSLADITERMEDALARVEYLCISADAENLEKRRSPKAPEPTFTPQQIAMIRKAVQG